MNFSMLFFTAAAATLAAGLSVSASTANAQTMKPGLWEVATKLGGSPGIDQAMVKMQQQLASMPPEQRKMMEDMMARKGVGMAPAAGGGMAAKVCITREMAERNQMPMQQHGNCTTTTSDKTASSMKMKFTCTNPSSSGEGQFTFSGDSAYTLKMNVSSAQQGVPRNTTIESSGKWSGVNCGAIKPAAMLPAK